MTSSNDNRMLVIDSATEACSVALFENGELLAGDYRLLGRGHAEALVPMIAALPGRGRAGRIAVALGPGSFTGVRVGLAAARGLALAWGADVVGYPSLDLVAAIARAESGARPVAVAMTGGHGEWFIEGYDADGTIVRPLASLRPAEAAAASPEELVAGTQAKALVAARQSGEALEIWPDARRVTLLPPSTFTADIQPLYGRAPDAKPMAARAATDTKGAAQR
ncbi:tRNA (adenosine(37)-N6)-threonylcarbamoyltransferase complex dimerization subunit type 1 TsaB [Sphingomonas sp. IC081]|uniref:tRNA (adenosine(37)-N6)-threonylcarbamoyltransferase complex dimerization subunit type 1 TsaB n=1 Tax=Sphingomonas sp. IC081 TaxID=304378 RepID=UPI00115B127B|nr:tRNA (adenosine(37)-N6)-threonylcarbamoyltransferase complex dimerization subunit type 1 TsaB [Sphingomonas sp. IC081]QDK33283.1 tRNA (adenosine(37)-N6)-threonylcarbamoyltransferase complex dimerization subunit type 1 TsaB [Sphingomonas sp. IC081]